MELFKLTNFWSFFFSKWWNEESSGEFFFSLPFFFLFFFSFFFFLHWLQKKRWTRGKNSISKLMRFATLRLDRRCWSITVIVVPQRCKLVTRQWPMFACSFVPEHHCNHVGAHTYDWTHGSSRNFSATTVSFNLHIVLYIINRLPSHCPRLAKRLFKKKTWKHRAHWEKINFNSYLYS